MSYQPSTTIKKGGVEGIVIGLIAAGAAKLAVLAQAKGVAVSADWIMIGATAAGSAIYKAVSNWMKNRKK